MNAKELKDRTQSFALQIIRFVQTLSGQGPSGAIGRQLLRCGTSVGANYRAACRAKSRADFISKLKIVEEECDESLYWMELLVAAELADRALLGHLVKEANQIVSIVVASIHTAREAIDR